MPFLFKSYLLCSLLTGTLGAKSSIPLQRTVVQVKPTYRQNWLMSCLAPSCRSCRPVAGGSRFLWRMTTKLTPSSTGVVQKETPGFQKKTFVKRILRSQGQQRVIYILTLNFPNGTRKTLYRLYPICPWCPGQRSSLCWPKDFWNLIFGEFDEPNFRGGFPVSPQESQQETSAENPQREVSGMFAIG